MPVPSVLENGVTRIRMDPNRREERIFLPLLVVHVFLIRRKRERERERWKGERRKLKSGFPTMFEETTLPCVKILQRRHFLFFECFKCESGLKEKKLGQDFQSSKLKRPKKSGGKKKLKKF